MIDINRDTKAENVLKALMFAADENGFATYQAIEKRLRYQGLVPLRAVAKRNSRISRGIDGHEGFLHAGKIQGVPMKEKISKADLLTNEYGKGFRLKGR